MRHAEHSISPGIMLMSYTNAINKQEQRSGSLFRQNTKIQDGWIDDVITLTGKYKNIFLLLIRHTQGFVLNTYTKILSKQGW
ncbi:MAG: hypothetical protein IPO92_07550 [Saprospiraceae bacterium]|nr:hypothetical protein [Saprospiraceae bacterium]